MPNNIKMMTNIFVNSSRFDEKNTAKIAAIIKRAGKD
jgi:hypothetical protein